MRLRLLALYILAPTLIVSAGCGSGQLLSRVPGISGAGRFLPRTNEYPELVKSSNTEIYRGQQLTDYLGGPSHPYIVYGATNMATADYTLGGTDRHLTIEVYTMENQVAAAGLFHYVRGKHLRGRGTAVDLGAEGVLDRDRENRNLYYYIKSQIFKIVYSGPKPVPNLVPLGRKVAGIHGGTSAKPKGFNYMDVPGVDGSTAHVTPGYTFNCDFLPAGIFASAPGAGPIAEVFLIGHNSDKDATQTARDYRTYLELNGLNYTMKYGPDRRRVWWARDKDQGRVICTRYKDWVVGVVRPRSYEKGEVLLDAMVERIRRDRYR